MLRRIINRLRGKTKVVEVNDDNTCTFVFTDQVCTAPDGSFDPGANVAGGLTMDGAAKAAMCLTAHFMPKVQEAGIPTHFIECDHEKGTILVKQVTVIPVEWIWRSKSWGSFCKSFGVEQGMVFNPPVVETTLKDDPLGDPRICEDAVIAIKKITREQYQQCDTWTRQLGCLLHSMLQEHGYELIDLKFEYGLDTDGNLMLIDEISGNIFRCLDKDGKSANPVDIAKTICPQYYQ